MKPNFVTGQQTGLLGGPLYTAYKVLGAIFHAKQNNGRAVYWLETNDADFNEINHIDFLDADGQLRTLTWDIPSQGYATGHIPVDRNLIGILETFFSHLRPTEFTPVLRELALDSYQEGLPLAEASVRLARNLFGSFPVQLFTPFDPDYRAFIQPMLRAEARHTPEGGQCHCFCLADKQRKALFRGGDRFFTREGLEVNIEATELVPNVKTRSVCQDAWFQTDTYIAGPGEAAYLAELGPFYQFHHVRPARVQRRMSLLLLDQRALRMAAKNNLAIDAAVQTDKNELLGALLTRSSGFSPRDAQNKTEALMNDFLAQMQLLNPEPADIKLLRQALRDGVKKMLGSIRAREKEKAESLLRDTAFLSDFLRPFGKKQERVFNIFYFMNLYGGMGFLQFLLAEYAPEKTQLEIPHDRIEFTG